MKLLVDITGWLGALVMLSAYVLLTVGRLKSQSPLYHWLNIVSARDSWPTAAGMAHIHRFSSMPCGWP